MSFKKGLGLSFALLAMTAFAGANVARAEDAAKPAHHKSSHHKAGKKEKAAAHESATEDLNAKSLEAAKGNAPK